MSGALSHLVRQSGIYALGNVAVKLSGVLLAPFLLNPAYLSVRAYGYLALLTVTAQLGVFVVGLGLGTGLLRFMSGETDKAERAALPFTALVTMMAVAAVALGALWAVAGPLAALLLDDGTARLPIRLVALYIVFKAVGGIPMMLLRVQERAGLYAVAVTAEMGVLLGGIYVLLVHQGRGLEGVMQAYTWSAGVSMTVMVAGMLAKVRWRFQGSLVAPLVRFGMPLVMVGLAGWFLNAGDRYLLKWLAEPETVGLYDWAARLAGVINVLFVQSFQLAFTVIGLKALGTGNIAIYRRTFRHYLIWTGWAVLGLSLLTLDAMTLLVKGFAVDPYYLNVDTLVLPLALGFLAYGLYIVFNNVLLAMGHTSMISINVVGAALLNGVLNMIMIPVLGALGAALTTAVAYAALALMTALVAQRKQPVAYPWRVCGIVLVMILGLYGLGTLTAAWPAAVRLPVRLLLILAYLAMIPVFRLYTVDELRTGWAAIRQARTPGAG